MVSPPFAATLPFSAEGCTLDDSELTLVSAAWRYRWLVAVVTALAVALGLIYHLVRPQEEQFLATASAVIQEPFASVDAVTPQTSSTEYIRTQLEIMRSPVVAEAAADIMNEAGFEMTDADLISAVNIIGSSDSPLVTVEAEASTPEEAIALANALADGYREVTQRQIIATTDAQLERIDAQIEAINDRLAEIEGELAEVSASDESLAQMEANAREATEQIARLQTELLNAADIEEAALIRQEIDNHREVVAVYNEVAAAGSNPVQQALLEEQSGQIDRRARLLILFDEISVDAGLSPDATALVQPAAEATPISGLGLSRILAVALILGLAAGIALAYFLASWRRTLTNRAEPQAILAAPMLADIPDFAEEALSSTMPVRDHPRSAAAEAFRFAASATEAAARSAQARSVFFASGTIGHGKTTTAVNVAMAAAFNGRSVILVDCDFGNQEASRLLIGDDHGARLGVTDYIEGRIPAADGIHHISLGNGFDVSLMPRGTRPSLAAAALQSDAARDLFAELVGSYELVIVDGPPVLQVAYAATLASLSDVAVVVVEHESSYAEVTDLKARLDLMNSYLLGYVYNRSPLRREMTVSEGSMMDILGDAGLNEMVESRRQRTR